MSDSKRCLWRHKGYELFSQGETTPNVERMARELVVSKSSFYHYFHNSESFIDALLEMHMDRTTDFADEMASLENPLPDVVHLFLRRKEDLFFHKYLRVNRDVPAFRKCFEESIKIIEEPMLVKWIMVLNLHSRPLFAKAFFTLLTDNFFLRITPSTLSQKWLEDFLGEAMYFLEQGLQEKKT